MNISSGTPGLSGDTMILVADKKGLHVYSGDGDFIKSKRPKCGGTIYGVGMCFDVFQSFALWVLVADYESGF